MTDARPITTRKDWSSDQEVRWCPGCGDYSILTAVQLLMPELGVRRENTVFVSGIGCAARFPYYMNTYGMHTHPRPGAGHRHRPGHGPARPRRVGRHRRRRRAVDRRQPPDPRAAPQREPHDPDVQQPDLRADQGPVLADQRGRQGHQVDAVRLARHAVQPDQPGPRRRGHLRGPHPRHGPQAHDGDVPAGPRPPGRRLRRDLPELQRLQRRRLRDGHRQGAPRATMLIPLVHGEPIRFGADGEKGVVLDTDRAGSRSSTWPTWARTPSSSTTRARRPRPGLHARRVWPRGPHEPTPDRRVPGRRRRSETPSTAAPSPPDRRGPGAQRPRRPRRRCSTAAPPGPSTERSLHGPSGRAVTDPQASVESERRNTTPVLGLG